MASHRLAVELWEAILRYSISVPVLFDADPIEESGFDSFVNLDYRSTAYWRSERQRNILRRVCWGWNTYLKQFDHRLVRLVDINECLVPESAIYQAIRLEYEAPDQWDQPEVALIREAILASDEPWKLEILDGGNPQIDNPIINSGKAPSIRTIFSSMDLDLKTVAAMAPTVRFLDIYFDQQLSVEVLKLSQLTSLTILIPNVDPLFICNFPLLKHLNICISPPMLMTMKDFQQLLIAIGKNLVTLFDTSTACDELLSPEEVWYQCPNLRRFESSLTWPADARIPKSLHTLYIPFDKSLDQSSSITSRLPISGLQSARSTVLSLSGAWRDAVNNNNRSFSMDYVTCAMDLGIPFYDFSGVKLLSSCCEIAKQAFGNLFQAGIPSFTTSRVLKYSTIVTLMSDISHLKQSI